MRAIKSSAVILLCMAVCFAAALQLVGCGSSTGTTPASTSTSTDSITDLPAVSTLVSGGEAAAAAISKDRAISTGKAVTGTPPRLREISSSNADQYFWNGLAATISGAGSATQSQIDTFWQGEGACRMAQVVGYSFQNVLQGGTSLCYMQNVGDATNGITVTSGSVSDVSKVFDQVASNKVVQFNTSNIPGGSENQSRNIFVKVYGSGSSEAANGYAADLWFCSSDQLTGYEEMRVNNSGGSFDLYSIANDFGTFVAHITASLTTSGGQFVFDSSKERAAQVSFGPPGGAFTFLGSVSIDGNGLLTAREYNSGTREEQAFANKHAVFANYTGETMNDLRFTTGSFALLDDFGIAEMTIRDGTEFNTSFYTDLSSGTIWDAARTEEFTNNLYEGASSDWSTTVTSKISALSNFSCTTQPDVVLTIDFSASGPAAVATACENTYSDMEFCDSQNIRDARQIVFQSQMALSGECPTSFCTTGDDFSCQKWADNNPGNQAGLTTANAQCVNNCCAVGQ